ncbi:hypothetical protein QVD17_00352 [Tagetes erecta]|uniref:Uncharacterized protein n=1 Tax=Tagetes erecta TaxID=13708 RepID=A0AAD8L5M2_TARER|nr:hypothetical protein QVD17_00352 [Tagetes erecta]
MKRIQERYKGKWICGLCGEAVKDEIVRSERLISTEEAMMRDMFVGINNFKELGLTTNTISSLKLELFMLEEHEGTEVYRTLPTCRNCLCRKNVGGKGREMGF